MNGFSKRRGGGDSPRTGQAFFPSKCISSIQNNFSWPSRSTDILISLIGVLWRRDLRLASTLINEINIGVQEVIASIDKNALPHIIKNISFRPNKYIEQKRRHILKIGCEYSCQILFSINLVILFVMYS